MRIWLGHLEYGEYLELTIWLLDNNLSEVLHINSDWKTYTVDFENKQDATAFRLRFGL
jgi:hypothetical protein